MVQIMRIIPPFSLIFTISLLVSGCRGTALVDPWAYAPKASFQSWKPELMDQKMIDSILPGCVLEVPKPDELVSLGDLFDIGLLNSPTTAESWQDARAAAAGYAVSLAPYLPNLAFSGELNATRSAFISTTPTGNQLFKATYQELQPQVALNYLLWDSGQTRTNAEYYFQTLQQMNWTHNETVQTVMQNIAKAYYDYLYAKEMLIAANSDLLNAEQSFKAAEDKLVSGIFNETDTMQARTNYLQKKVATTTQIANVENAFVDLLNTLGIPADLTFELGSFPATPPLDPFNMNSEELVTIAKQRRPEYQAAKANVLAQESYLKNAKAQILPQLQLAATGGNTWYAGGLNDGGDYSVTVDLTFPIFSGFYYSNQIKKAKSVLKTSVANLRSTELGIIRDVKISHNTFVMAKSQLVDAKNYLDSADIEFRAMLSRYKMGLSTILDLLSSESFLSDARAAYVQAQKTYYMSIINIAFATGLLNTEVK